MRNRRSLIAISILTLVLSCLCSCRDKSAETAGPAASESSGNVQDTRSPVLTSADDDDEVLQDERAERLALDQATQLDVRNLPDDIKRMAGLCDAINMACVERRTTYGVRDGEFIWYCVRVYMCDHDDDFLGSEIVADRVDVPPETVDNILHAMFGELTAIPDIPAITDLSSDIGNGGEDLGSYIVISNDMKYRFTLGDRGLSAPELRSVKEFPDSSLEMEVALIDAETEEEIVSFIYSMRPNTRNTTTSAMFAYEITQARAADKETADKMDGMPFLTQIVQTYGNGDDEDSPKSNEVVEILYYTAYADNVPGMDELNARISHEILEYANSPEDEDTWREIISYPLTTQDHVQFAVTYATYPSDEGDPDIRCYNYDKKKRRAMDHNDALTLCGRSDDELTERVTELWKGMNPSGDIDEISYRGFIVRANGSADVFFMITAEEEGAGRRKLFAYNSGTDELRYAFEPGDVIPADETDDIKPELTHGRKDS